MSLGKHWAATLDDYVIDLAWSPDGSLLAAASAAGGITLFDAASGTIRQTLPGHEDGANCLAWRPAPQEEQLLASGGQDGKVRLWRGGNGAPAGEASLGSAWVEYLAWAGTGAALNLFAAAGRKLVALDAAGAVVKALPDAPKTISALAAAPAAQLQAGAAATKSSEPCLAAAYFGGVALWSPLSFSVVREYPYGNAIPALVWSPDGRWLVAGCQDNAVHLWAPAEDVELHMSGYESKLRELSFSADSKWLATGGGRDACVWDCSGDGPANREPTPLPHQDRVCAVAFQNQHNRLASAAIDGEFALWAPAHRQPLLAQARLPSPATRLAWRHDDSLIAAGTEAGTVFVFKV